MDMKEQMYMLAIDKYGGIKAAADSLHISPPALSIFLSSLEDRIGVHLFDRIGKQFLPTEAGKLYLDHARRMMEIRDHYELELKRQLEGITGKVCFGIQPRRSLYLLAPVLTKFSAQFPQIEVIPCEESSPQMLEHLRSGALDFIITNTQTDHPSILYMPLYQDHLVAVLAADHPACSKAEALPGQPIPWLDLTCLNGSRFILQKPDQAIRYYTDQVMTQTGVQPGRIFILENMETACQLAAEGYGVAFNYLHFIRHFQYEKPVSIFLTGNENLPIHYFIATLKGKELNPHTHALIRLFQEQMQGG